MPYIATEEVAKIRAAIKAAVPGFKVSVTREHHSSVYVRVMEGPIAIDLNNRQVNHFYTDRIEDPAQREVWEKIKAAIDSVAPRKIESEDGDYGSIPNYYLNFAWGKWDKPYVQKAA